MLLTNKIFTFTALIHDRKSELKTFGKDIIKSVLANLKRYTFFFAVVVYYFSVKGTLLMQYVKSAYDNKVYLPLSLIREAMANDWLDSLCYYVWMKKMHRRPVIYNYSLRKVAAALKCSPTTVKTHISVLIKQNVAHLSPHESRNLHLKSTREFFKGNGLMVPVKVSYKKSEQRDLLRFAAIKRNLHTQVRKFEQKNKVLLYHKGINQSHKDTKTAIRLAKDYPNPTTLESSMQNVLTLSNKKIGAMCNRKQCTGINIQKSLNAIGLIASTARTSLIDPKKHTRRQFFAKELDSSHFLSDFGRVFRRLTNGITLKETSLGDNVVLV